MTESTVRLAVIALTIIGLSAMLALTFSSFASESETTRAALATVVGGTVAAIPALINTGSRPPRP